MEVTCHGNESTPLYRIHNDEIIRMYRDVLHEFEHYQAPSPVFFFGSVPQPEDGLVIRKTVEQYLPLSDGSQRILDMAYDCFERSGISVNRYGPASIEYWLFHYNDAAFHDTLSLPSNSSPSDLFSSNHRVHLCLFLVQQDMLVSPTYIDICRPSDSSWTSFFSWDSSDSTETIRMDVGNAIILRHNNTFKLHGCSGFGNRHLIMVFMTESRTAFMDSPTSDASSFDVSDTENMV